MKWKCGYRAYDFNRGGNLLWINEMGLCRWQGKKCTSLLPTHGTWRQCVYCPNSMSTTILRWN